MKATTRKTGSPAMPGLPAEPRRILVIRLSSLGDVVLTTPVLANVKAAWPRAQVSVLVKEAYADVFLGNPAVDHVLRFETRGLWGWLAQIRRERFDICLDLHDTPRSRVWSALSGSPWRVRLDKRARERRRLVRLKESSPALAGSVKDRYLECLAPLGVPVVFRRPALYAHRSAEVAGAWARRLGPGPFVAVAPGAAHPTKQWPAERFAAAADAVARRLSGRILLVGSRADEAAALAVLQHVQGPAQNLTGRTTVADLIGVISRSAVMLTNDSGAMHVASALGVPTVAVFGPTVEAFGFFPEPDCSVVLERKGLYCRPCALHGGRACPEQHFRCMNEISADEAVQAASQILARGPAFR